MPQTTCSRRGRTFLLALGIATLMFLPFVIFDKGLFIYYGDFNVQQIPFYKLAHEAVRNGNVFWSFYTDLGANFIGSYSFYLLFSPFFWLTLLFPTAWVPYMMAPLLILKTACAALTAYIFLERFVRDRDYAVVGALLYAFSGWMDFNIFFNHFHEAAVFFPLLLLGVEKLVNEDKKAFFAAMVAVNAAVNYWFFVGEAVFTVLYVIIRMTDKSWGMNLRRFIRLAAEAVLGVGLVAVVLVPSVMALTGNPRTGTDSLLTGWNFWIYWQNQNQAAVLQSLFFPPELPARLNFFPDAGAAWSSRSAWLPLIGPAGVLAYFFGRKNDWVKKILALSLVFALVPGLNAIFILFNHSYYARWFYMPILLMCLATACALEESAENTEHMSRSIKWCLAASLLFTVISGLTPQMQDGELLFGLASDHVRLWVYAIVVMACLLMLTALVVRLRDHPHFKRFLTGGVALISVAFGIYYLANGKNNAERSRFVANTAIGGRELIHLPDDNVEGAFSRIDVYDGLDNLGMFWMRPTIQAFHSIVPPSLMEFYPEVGVKRDVGSRPEAEFYALRPLLSVRWLFIEPDKDQEPMPGYVFSSEQIGLNVYENENYLPMGLGYTSFVERDQLSEVSIKTRANLMLRALVFDDWDTIERSDSYMLWHDTEGPQVYTYDGMVMDIALRRELSCYYFSHDNRGFTARSNLDRDVMMFFSVPYEKGWAATVNGVPAVVERVNLGFMGVHVPPGEAEIRFDYFTPGLKEGAAVSAGVLVIFVAYMLAARLGSGREKARALDAQLASFLKNPADLRPQEDMASHDDIQPPEEESPPVRRGSPGILEILDEEERTFLLDENEDDNPPTPPEGFLAE